MGKNKWVEEEVVEEVEVSAGGVEGPISVDDVVPAEGPISPESPESPIGPIGPVSSIPPKVPISIDNRVEDVVDYDQAGQVLDFQDEPGRFLKLPSEVVKGLSPSNRDCYFLAYGANQVLVEEASMGLPEGLDIKVSGMSARATAKLEIYNKRPGMHYCWKRPDELQQAIRMGYRVSEDSNLETLVSSPSRIHRISALGEDELIAMEIPEAGHQAILRAQKEKSDRLEGAVEAQARREISRIGPVFDPKEVDGRKYNFTAPVDEAGNPLPNTG